MPELAILIGHWGYLAIFVVVLLGNLGLPIPEEMVLVLGGYMAWKQELWLPAVLAAGIVGVVAGDNLGYWIGRRCGRPTIDRYGHLIFVTPERLDLIQRLVTRHGPLGIFLARFCPGLRFMAGPLAGTLGMSFFQFLIPTLLGALVHVPAIAALGYALGYGLGDDQVVGNVERIGVIAVVVCVLAVIGWRVYRGSVEPYRTRE
jgi:membrane protein DedA with SNARE-associated domain